MFHSEWWRSYEQRGELGKVRGCLGGGAEGPAEGVPGPDGDAAGGPAQGRRGGGQVRGSRGRAGRGGAFEEAAVLGWTSAMLDQYFDEICEAYCEIALEHRALQELNEFRTTLIAHLMTMAGLDSIDVSLDQANELAGIQLRSNFIDAAGELTSSLPDRTGFRLTVVRLTSSRRH